MMLQRPHYIFFLLFAAVVESASKNYKVKSYDRGGRMGRFLGLFTIVSFSDDECNVDGVKGKKMMHFADHLPSNVNNIISNSQDAQPILNVSNAVFARSLWKMLDTFKWETVSTVPLAIKELRQQNLNNMEIISSLSQCLKD